MAGEGSLRGRTIGHYRVDSELGRGGMGVVYLAHDTRLDRPVAIKVLPPEAAERADARARFLREARAASALTHPNIVTVHAIEAADGLDFIVMEFVGGRPLDQLIARTPLSFERVAEIGSQIADALAAAHARRIVHRDIKPSNVLITPTGLAKVADFGLARQAPTVAPDQVTMSGEAFPNTRPGVVLGTLHYMAPEQARGETVTDKADVFSLGVTLYEMTCGRRPFSGPTDAALAAARLYERPSPLASVRPGTPAALATVVERCLSRDIEARPSAAEVKLILDRLARPDEPAARGVSSRWLQATLAVLLVGVVAIGGWLWRQNQQRTWARDVALPEVRRLVGAGRYIEAFHLVTRALNAAPEDETVRQEMANATFVATLESQPPGATVSFSAYAEAGPWTPLGKTPIADARIPIGVVRWRAELAGYDTLESSGQEDLDDEGQSVIRFNLVASASAPPGMVYVPEGRAVVNRTERRVPAFWIDRLEVSNRDYQKFVDAGGYRRADWWPELAAAAGTSPATALDAAIASFQDTTGRPGPADWALGAFREGQGDHPVNGISWYEAAAYARFVGKQLPTAFHWQRTAGLENIFSDILSVSSFGRPQLVAAGSSRGLGPFGTLDMAGNVREWTSSASADLRFILGGAWDEPVYRFRDTDAALPSDRSLRNGVRLIKSDGTVPPAVQASLPLNARDYRQARAASDEVFAAYSSAYSYDAAPLDVRVIATDDSNPYWRKEHVSFAAGYGRERVPAFVFVPRNAKPPYQAVVYSPAGDALVVRSSAKMSLMFTDFVIRSGRLVVCPILKGTYERWAPITSRNGFRDVFIQRSQDVRRSLDYVLSRGDVDPSRVAFYGASLGGSEGVNTLGLERRFRTAILFAAGFERGPEPPEIDTVHFAPRVTLPTLMVNGRDDFSFPLERAQRPLFERLGTPAADKRHVIVDGGHIPTRLTDLIKHALDWLDERMGRVTP